MKVRWGASVTSMALLACVGVDEEEGGLSGGLLGRGGGRLGEGRGVCLLATGGLLDFRGLYGVRLLVVSDDHEGIKAAVAGELCRE